MREVTSLFSPEDRQELIKDFHEAEDLTCVGLCLHQILERVVRDCGDKTAFICGDSTITFSEVNNTANRVARLLQRRGVQHGDIIGVALERSVNLVPVLMAVLKTGATYVPLDPSLPTERINQMMEDACPKMVITSDDTLLASTRWEDVCLGLDDLLSLANSTLLDSDNLDLPIGRDDLAYIMYTSGSTGRPKGVEIRHGSIANLLSSMRKEPGCNEKDRLLAVTTISFDMAVLELFLPMACCATTVIAQKHEVRDPTALLKLMDRHTITMMQATPATWQMLVESGWKGLPRLQKILCGGEALSRRLADHLMSCGDKMWNMYGPTEATVYASIWRVCQGCEVVIGHPVANCYLYVLDRHRSSVPVGQPGELYIGGAGVARGYRNHADLSRSSFLPNLFNGGLMYRTGDLACFLQSGELKLMGRIDKQVKIRGNRVELGDIEAALAEHEDTSDAVVVCRKDRLIAYYVRKVETSASKDYAKTSFEHVLRSWLAQRLPNYMIPAFLMEVKAVPVTPNGKIDHKALPDPVAAPLTNGAAYELTNELAKGTSKINTELESRLLTVWSKVLERDHIDTADNFFEIGGDSIRLVRVQKELQNLLGRFVPISTLFECFTVKTLVEHLTSSHETISLSSLARRDRTNSHEDIAIVSMSCRLPGDITTPNDFWQLLESGGDAITDVPKGRWESGIYENLVSSRESCYNRGGFISSINSFDLSFFGISPREAKSLDPAQYMMLETCWEGFERAGYTRQRLRGSQTGVFIGTSNILAHLGLNTNAIKDLVDLDGYTATGSAGGTMSGRISHQLDLWGPTITIDTACSSSLVTTHLACTALRQGDCDMAVSGGISLMLNPGLHVEFGRLGGMSPDGLCRSFDADAQGTGWSEGCAVVILKRLSDAQQDGDTIHAVIRGTATNHDGRSATLTTPSGNAQERLIHTTLNAAGLRPEDIDYVEAHGTATKLGDPIEATAIGKVFGPSRCDKKEPLWVGSAKSNVGHTQAAAGLIGLLKVVLSMQNNTLPQTLHVVKPTLAVDWEHYNMMTVMQRQRWKSQGKRLRRAGVSAFGIGGTNAHVIIEEAPKPPDNEDDVSDTGNIPTVMPFLLSGETDAALRAQADKLGQYVHSEIDDSSMRHVAYSLATGRDHFRRRMILKASTKDELVEEISSVTREDDLTRSASVGTGEEPRVAVMFTGQGSQWPGMGKDVSDVFPVFREMLSTVAQKFVDLDVPLLEVMWAEPGSPNEALLRRTDFAQAALFTLEVALWQLWQSWGVKPEFVTGHSLGDIVAAHVAGVLDLSDACRLVTSRGKLMQTQHGDYMMASLEAQPFEVSEAVEQLGCVDSLDVAAYNTPSQMVVSGRIDAIQRIVTYFAEIGRKTNVFIKGHAFHSRYIEGMLTEFRAVVETLHFNPPRIKVVSSLNGQLVEPKQLEQTDYWVRQVRQTVRFRDSINELALQGANIFLEMGPQSTLCGMGAACLAENPKSSGIAWLPSLSSRNDSITCMLRSLAELHIRHVPVDWHAYFKTFNCRRSELPTYAFQRDFSVQLDTRRSSTRNSTTKLLDYSHTSIQESLEFEVTWHSTRTKNALARGVWGLLPLHDSSEAMVDSLRLTLQTAGIKLIDVENLKHTKKLDGLISFWNSEADLVSQAQSLTIKALEELQMAVQLQLKVPLVWITCNAVGTGVEADDRKMKPAAATLWGLMRTAQREHPELHLRLIDVDESLGNAITPALCLNNEAECAIRADEVLVPRLQAIKSVSTLSAGSQLVRGDGAILITGGLGYIGGQIARWLARQHGVRDLVLVSRRGRNTQGAESLVEELSALGVRVTILGCDIADPRDIESVFEIFNEDRRLRGVIHAAGTSDPGILSAMTPERCIKTLAPKVTGAWLLHQAVQDVDLDFFVMLSSISGIIGMPGLANYSAANTFLDALAHLRRARGLPATSVAYGTWMGDGMAARLSKNTNSHLARFGLDALETSEALNLLHEAMASNRALTVSAALDPDRLRGYCEEEGGVPSLLRTFLQVDGASKRSNQDKDLRSALNATDHKLHDDIVLDKTRQVFAKMLGFSNLRDVDVDRPLQDMGIDSLTAVQARNHLTSLTGLKLPVNIAMLHPNLRTLAKSLLFQMSEQAALHNHNKASEFSDLISTAATEGSLDANLKFENMTESLTKPVASHKSAFLTGATGFVGTFVLYELLKRDITTHCLVRAGNVEQARERIEKTLENYDLWKPSFASLIKPIIGDMSQHMLGLSEKVFDEIANGVDAICHCGGLVDWMRPMEDYVGPNIVSTHETLRLASRGRAKSVHLVSTISTLPKHMGLSLTENDREYGYGTSKYIAERLVSAARWRGAEATIYRLPYVTASTATGHFRRDRGDFLHNLVSGCLALGAFPSLDADMSMVLPVDYLSGVIVDVMTQGFERRGQDFDFLSSRAPTCNDFFKLVGAVGGGNQEILPYKLWKDKAMQFASAHPTSPVARIAAVLDSYTEETAAGMFKGSLVGPNVLGGTTYPAPLLDETFIRKYLDCMGQLT